MNANWQRYNDARTGEMAVLEQQLEAGKTQVEGMTLQLSREQQQEMDRLMLQHKQKADVAEEAKMKVCFPFIHTIPGFPRYVFPSFTQYQDSQGMFSLHSHNTRFPRFPRYVFPSFTQYQDSQGMFSLHSHNTRIPKGFPFIHTILGFPRYVFHSFTQY